MNNYREIFIGGGSVMMRVLEEEREGRIRIEGGIYGYDINESLIWMYKNIQKRPKELYNKIKEYKEEYERVEDKEGYYYKIRREYNEMRKRKKIENAALFIMLNKLGFRGMYREGKNGYNVPYGNYKNPEIINLEHLEKMSELIKKVKFRRYEFNKSINKAEENDYLYLDPPYYPDKNFKTAFVKYNQEGFDEEKHKELFNLIKEKGNNKRIKFMMSNNEVENVIMNFKDYTKIILECKRKINSKKPNSKTNELLIKNY